MTSRRTLLSPAVFGRPRRTHLLLRTRIVLLLLVASTALAAIVGIPLAALWNLSEADFTAQQQALQQEEWDNVVLADADELLSLTTKLLAMPELHNIGQTGGGHVSGDAVDQLLSAAVSTSDDDALQLIAVLGADGQLLHSSSDPKAANGLLDALSLVRGIKATKARVGLFAERTGKLALIAAAPLGKSRLFIIGRGDRLLDGFSPRPDTKLFLVGRSGDLLESNAVGEWPLARGTRIRVGEVRTIHQESRWFTLIATEVEDLVGSPIATLIAMRDTTASIQQRQLVLLNTAAAVLVCFLLVGLLLYGYVRRALAPLGDLTRMVGRLAAGDVMITAPVGQQRQDRDDELGAIARAMEVFRRNAIGVQRLETRASLQTAQQQALIRREMQGLAETLAEPARSAILADLERIEIAAWDARSGAGALQAGQGTALAVAFKQMVARVVEQHRQLHDLLAERTRDLAVVREALQERAQLVRMREELDIARRLQLSSLPMKFPAFPDRSDFDLYATIEPAREVGGDFYDFLLLDENRLAVLIGDASGKGVAAALFIARARTLLRSSIGAGASPARALAFANAALLADNPSAMFATAFAAIIDLRAGSLLYACAGHNPPYLLRSGALPEQLDRSQGAALGVLEIGDYTDIRIELQQHDELFLFTDGVTEAMTENAEFFGDERLAAVLRDDTGCQPTELVRVVRAALAGFVAGTEQADDITMLAIAYYGEAKNVARRAAGIEAIESEAPADAAFAPR